MKRKSNINIDTLSSFRNSDRDQVIQSVRQPKAEKLTIEPFEEPKEVIELTKVLKEPVVEKMEEVQLKKALRLDLSFLHDPKRASEKR